jgi:hypothetical protein
MGKFKTLIIIKLIFFSKFKNKIKLLAKAIKKSKAKILIKFFINVILKSKVKIKPAIKKAFKNFCIINTARVSFFSFFLRYKKRDTGFMFFSLKK